MAWAKLLRELQEKGFIYSDGDALWFRTTAFGDDKDRVVVRQNGDPTYFAADIAYHLNKFQRGFETVIDIWGADHHGYIPRMSAAVQALGYGKDALKVILVQLVNLLRGGKPVAMSTRSGEFVTLREVVDEVGKDAARYNFLMRRSDSHLDFDLEVAKRQSNENPVYYVQYAHARICSIIRMAAERGCLAPAYGQAELGLLTLPEEIDLIKAITRFPEVVEGAALTLEPHRLTFYLNDLAGLFHSYYNKNKVISDDGALTGARLFLVTVRADRPEKCPDDAGGYRPGKDGATAFAAMTAKNRRVFELRLGKVGLIVFISGMSVMLFSMFLLGIIVGKHMEAYPERYSSGITDLIRDGLVRCRVETGEGYGVGVRTRIRKTHRQEAEPTSA